MLGDWKARVAVGLVGAIILALLFDVVMIRRNARAAALLRLSGSPPEKQELLARVERLGAEHDELLQLTRTLQLEEQRVRRVTEARRQEVTKTRMSLAALKEDALRADEFLRLKEKGSCNGNYLDLMRVEREPGDRVSNGDFKEVGSRFLRRGYWVYVHPYWFVWSRSRREQVEAERSRKQREAQAARREAESRRQRQLEQTYGDRIDARLMAQDFAKQHLTHPSTAKFPFFSGGDTFLNAAKGQWHVTGKVKAKNVFGLELTYRWKVVVRRVQGDTWQLIDIEMWEEGT